MSKPRYIWWGYVVHIVEMYPQRKKAVQLSKVEKCELDAVEAAIKAVQTENEKVAKEILKIVELVDFKNTHTLEGAAQVCFVSYETAKRYRRSFLKRVAQNFKCDGLIDKTEIITTQG